LDDLLRRIDPGSDEYVIEGYASELAALLREWSHELRVTPPATATLGKFIDPAISSTSYIPMRETDLRPGDRIQALRRTFAPALLSGRDQCLDGIKKYLDSLGHLEVADFEIYECAHTREALFRLDVKIRYDFVGLRD